MLNRIQKIMEIEKLSPSQFADEINIQRSSLSHVLSGRNKPSLDFVMKIKKCFNRISLDWLLFGEGEMYEDNDKSSSSGELSDIGSFLDNNDSIDFNLSSGDKDKKEIHIDDKAVVEKLDEAGERRVVKLILLYADGRFEEYKK